MKSRFTSHHALGGRLILALMISIILMVADFHKLTPTSFLRNLTENGTGLIYYLANLPRYLLDGISDNFVERQTLLLENKALSQEIKEKNADLLILDQLKLENQRLRLLLNSPLRKDEYKKIATVLSAENNNYHQQLVINQGTKDGAFVGQAVIDEKGVVGQIISTGRQSSRILMITDIAHSLPVQILRTGERMIATGTGHSDELILDNVPNSADINVGDLIVTSGLSGRFPAGFPVAKIEKVIRNKQNYFATITAKPQANLASLRDVLLVWVDNKPTYDGINSPENEQPTTTLQPLALQKTQYTTSMPSSSIQNEESSQ